MTRVIASGNRPEGAVEGLNPSGCPVAGWVRKKGFCSLALEASDRQTDIRAGVDAAAVAELAPNDIASMKSSFRL